MSLEQVRIHIPKKVIAVFEKIVRHCELHYSLAIYIVACLRDYKNHCC